MPLAVDLGTSNTVAVLRLPDGRARALLFDGFPLLPSGVYLDEGGTLHVGRDAERLSRLDPGRYEPNPKRQVDAGTVLLGDVEVAVPELLAALLREVWRQAAPLAAGRPVDLVLASPATWGPRRRGVLTDAAVRAGLPVPRLVPEPVAAAAYFTEVAGVEVADGRCVLVFDFGAGTLDVAVVARQGRRFAVRAVGGLEDLGGMDLDAAVVESVGGVVRAATPDVWKRLASPADIATARGRRALWDDARAAKEMLSRASVAPISVPGLPYAVHITRAEFERLAGPLLDRAVDESARVVTQAGLRPEHLAAVLLVGGSSRVPMVSQLLHRRFGTAPSVLEQPELPVAEGALHAPGDTPSWQPPPPRTAPPPPPMIVPPPGPPELAGVPEPEDLVELVAAGRPWWRRPVLPATVAVLAVLATAGLYWRPFGLPREVGDGGDDPPALREVATYVPGDAVGKFATIEQLAAAGDRIYVAVRHTDGGRWVTTYRIGAGSDVRSVGGPSGPTDQAVPIELIADGEVVVASVGGWLSAFVDSNRSGAALWERKGTTVRARLLGPRRLAVWVDQNRPEVLDPATGQVVWRFDHGDVWNRAADGDTRALDTAVDGRVKVRNVVDGAVLASGTTITDGLERMGRVVAVGQALIVPVDWTPHGIGLYAFGLPDFAQRWSAMSGAAKDDRSADVIVRPCGRRLVCLAVPAGQDDRTLDLFAYDVDTGQRRWNTRIRPVTEPASGDGQTDTAGWFGRMVDDHRMVFLEAGGAESASVRLLDVDTGAVRDLGTVPADAARCRSTERHLVCPGVAQTISVWEFG